MPMDLLALTSLGASAKLSTILKNCFSGDSRLSDKPFVFFIIAWSKLPLNSEIEDTSISLASFYISVAT